MTFFRNGCVTALALTLLTGTAALSAPPAHAGNFLEQIFGGAQRGGRNYHRSNTLRGPDYGRGQRRVIRRDRRGNGNFPAPPPAQASRPDPAPAVRPVAKVTGPEYYTYDPDKLELISFDGLTDPVTTGSVSTGSDAMPVSDAFDKARSTLGGLRVRALAPVAKAINAHYSADPHFIWVTDGQVNAKARDALAVLSDAASVGLDPQDYAIRLPEDSFGGDDREALMRFEMEMSGKVLTYALDATRGRVDPNRISGYHDLPRKSVDLEAALAALKTSDEPGRWLSERNPQGGSFASLKQELKRLRDADSGPKVEIADGTFIRPGGTSPEMAHIVEAIRLKASDELKTEQAATFAAYSGGDAYAPDLVSLVRAFQKDVGLHVDGVVGSNTIKAMTGFTNADKIDKVVLAMERARWLPGVLPATRVFINEPAFQAAYFHNGSEALKTRAVVGKKNHQTNFFSDEIETVEFNPYWGVPQSIIINEMLPKLRRDSSYLDRLGYELTYKGKSVSSTAFNWNTIGSTKAFGVRQPPGSDNALGRLKILFPNSHAIYMHDTPSKNLFKRDVRAFSHGCVRLQDPRGMAAEVLGIDRDTVDGYIATGQNQGVEVPSRIPVFVAYFTAWPDAGGKVTYYGDIYDRDMYLDRALASTENARHAEG